MQVSELVEGLLKKRGITDASDIEKFLNPNFERDTHSPALLEGMNRALARLFAAMEDGETIGIYTDYDCDGIPGAAILHDFFRKIKYGAVEFYIPHRDREGYGFHKEAIDALAEKGVSLIITVDVGGAAHESIVHAKSLGVDVIVCDHHEMLHGEPDAVAILNPKLGKYPFRDLCGAAVAWKFVSAALAEGRERGWQNFLAVPDGWEKWLLDMVGIATVADIVPLIGENRVLAHFGLTVLRKSQRPGLRALLARTRVRQHEITEEDIGFTIAPRINAASRMDEPELAFRLLTTQDSNEAEKLAGELERLNTSRKGVVGSLVREANKRARTMFKNGERVIVLGNTDWKPALLGLAASSVVGERGGVVCLWGRDANGRIKGSCRTDGSVSVATLFSNAHDVFEEYGGHAGSGGFSVSRERVHELHDALTAALEKTPSDDVVSQNVDARIVVREVSSSLMNSIAQLAPFGAGNPKPLFSISRVRVDSMRQFGKEQNHLEFAICCANSGERARAYDFFRSPDSFTCTKLDGVVDVLGTVERDSYRGGLAVRIVDVVSAA